MTRLCVFTLAVVFSVPAVAFEVPLIVSEPVGAERPLEVVSGGIPFPAGKYKDATAFRLLDGNKEIPVQVSPMVRHPDGSLRWALVSFPVAASANSSKTYTLKDGVGAARPENPVTVKETGDMVEVSNGLVAFAVNKANFNGFEWVKVGGKEIFKATKAGLVAGGQGGPCKPISFDYYYRGPVRTTLYVKGTYGELKSPTYAMAITLNAGERAIHVAHNLRNARVGAEKLNVTSPEIRLGLAGNLQPGQSAVAPGKVAAFGWQSFTGAAELLVFMRHGGPRSKGIYKVEAAGGDLVIHLSSAGNDVELEQGAHKSTEIDLVFAKSASPEALASPLHARAPSGYYAAHDSFGVGLGWGSLEDETQTYKNAGWTNADDPKKMPQERPDPTLYQNWFDAHETSECDHLQGLTFGYVRTGQRGFLDQAHSWARYWRTYLLWRSDEFTYGKEGTFRTPKWGSGRCCSEGCHFYGVGIFNYALLTGDIDALEAAFDWAEMALVAWYGPYAGKKPGQDFSSYGSRGFVRCYLAVARAYDVARDDKWLGYLLHYANMSAKTPARDPRGFTIIWSTSNAAAAQDVAKKLGPAALELFEKEKVEVVGNKCKHPLYGEYQPKRVGSWPEAMQSMANHVAYEALSASSNPAAQLAAEDVMDHAIAQAYLGLHYIFHPVQKATYYYMTIDYPIPDYCPQWVGGQWEQYQPKGTDSWYTKWWPNTYAIGYLLTGDKKLREMMFEVIWWGLSRDHVNPPRVQQGEAPIYSRVEKNTKGDWMTPTALAFGVGARPKRDETSPAAVTDLKARSLGGGKVELTWTAPADPAGKVVRYQVKWAEKPLVDYLGRGDEYRKHFRNGDLTVTYWNMATNVLGEPLPGAPGKTETITLNVPVGKTLSFGVRSFDDSHNRSAISNVVNVEVR